MIANPKWFEIRKCGWGIMPKAWQGWVYIMGMISPLLILLLVSSLSASVRTALSLIWILLLCINASDIMIHIKKDERERLHEALAERNAAWFISFALVCGILLQVQKSIAAGTFLIDPLLIIALIGGALTKLFTYLYLKNK